MDEKNQSQTKETLLLLKSFLRGKKRVNFIFHEKMVHASNIRDSIGEISETNKKIKKHFEMKQESGSQNRENFSY